MAVFRSITLSYRGQDYAITPSVRLCRMIEGKARREEPGFNLAMAVLRIARGDVSYGDLCMISAEMLNHAGAKTNEDEVWQYLNTLDTPATRDWLTTLVGCFLDPEADEKKSEAPEKN